MIEFRYIERVVPAPEIGEDVGRTVLALQFRFTLSPHMNASGDIVMYVPDEPGPWTDIPVVQK